jgi:hypothetical protein
VALAFNHVRARSVIMSDPTPKRWTRTHTIWLLIVLSLTPGFTAVAFREGWHLLPAGVRGAAILVSAILIATVFSLIVTGGKDRKPDGTSDG